MDEVLKKLGVLKMSVESVVHNNRYPSSDKETQRLGDKLIAENFVSKLEEIIKCLSNSNQQNSSSSLVSSPGNLFVTPSAVISINAKCSDTCTIQFEDLEHRGYIPSDLGIGGGDYLRLSLDAFTGRIVDFKPLTKEQITDILED